jgi:hypothetical protein
MVTCPLAPDVPHLISGSCSSPRAFGLGFLQTPPHGDALALLLAFGSAKTWRGDFHPTSSVPCPAHTPRITGWQWSATELPVRVHAVVSGLSRPGKQSKLTAPPRYTRIREQVQQESRRDIAKFSWFQLVEPATIYSTLAEESLRG